MRFAPLMLLLCTSAIAQDMPLSDVLIDGQDWQLVGEGYEFTEGPAADADGTLYFTDNKASKIYRVSESGTPELWLQNTAKTNGLFFGPDGKLFGCRNGDRQIVAYDKSDGTYEVIAQDVDCNDLVVTADGGVYFTDPPNSRVWYVPPGGNKRIVAEGWRPNGVILRPDTNTLIVTDSANPWLWTFQIEPSGDLSGNQPFYRPLRLPYGQESPRSDGMTVDSDGRVYVATAVGIQLFDQEGRPKGVILKPHDARGNFGSNVAFGGNDRDWLYYTVSDRVFRRKVKTRGVTFAADSQ